jgi:signal transduction histidine kinase/ligand-binding sensor domain-containing protein
LKRQLSTLIACLALWFGAGRILAVDSPFAVDVWGTADGLPQSSAIALTQTRDGYLWLGTLNGLVRFDGNAFTCFNVNNTPGLPDNRVIFLFEDSRQTLWVGTDIGGLCAVKNGAVKKIAGGAGVGRTKFAFEDAQGVVWFCTAEGNIFCSRDGRLDLHPATCPPDLLYRAFHLQVSGKSGVTWRLQDGRIEKFRNGKLELDAGTSPWPGSFITAVYKMPDGGFVQIPFDAEVTDAREDSDGNLVVATRDAGVFWLGVDGFWRQIATEQGLSHKTVLSLGFDTEGNLWAGTDGGGLNRIRRKTFFTHAELHPWVAQSAAEDAAGGLWVAYNGQGISSWRTNVLQDYRIGARNNAWSVLVDHQQRVWAGTRGDGLFQFMSYYFQPVVGAEKIGKQIYALLEGSDGKIWVGGENGLASFDGSQWDFFSTTAGLPNNAVRALAEDAATNLWIGTEGGGLFCLNAGKISAAKAPVKDFSCLLADRDGGLWAGTSGHGLARFQNGNWSLCSTIHGGLTSDSIGYLADDDAGNLWLGSYEGLLRVEKKSLADFAAGRTKTVACRTFLTRECSAGAQPAAVRTHDGRLWFPMIEGLVSVNPAALKPNLLPPPVVIELVLVDGAEMNTNLFGSIASQRVVLTPEQEQLEIHFTALNFSAPKGAQFGARFKFRLEGRDKNWTDAGGERVAHFNRLTPGKYVFRVIACNEDGVWNEVGATLAVTVQPPFWRKPWFVAVSVLFMVGALAGIIYLLSTAKLKSQLRAARQKELIERERARIARDLHDQLGANLTQVTLLGEMAEADKNLPGEVEQHAQQIIETARDTTRSLDEIVWSLNSANDTLEGLANYACKYAQDYFALADVSFRAELPTVPSTPIPPEVRHNVFLAFKEAVNNVVKHAQATEARVKLQLEPEKFILTVADNGRGLGDISGKQLRNGLKNMRKRLADVRGEFEIVPGANGGTVVKLVVPLVPQ